jgi:hypothetical protein
MQRQIIKITFCAIFIILFGFLTGQVVSAKEAMIVFGVS